MLTNQNIVSENKQQEEAGAEDNKSDTNPDELKEKQQQQQQHQKKKLTIKEFQLIGLIGKGSYGEVWLAIKKDNNKQYAIKVIDKIFLAKENKQYQVYVEKEVLTKLNHQCIVKLYYSFQDKLKLYFVLEYVQQGAFSEYLRIRRSLNLEATKYYAAKLVSILEYLHSNGIAHRDIKPDNLLMTDQFDLKLIDFGTAKFFANKNGKNELFQSLYKNDQFLNDSDRTQSKCTFVGTAEYVSPEMLEENSSGAAGDLWALGCVIYEMYFGKTPYCDNSEYLTFQKIKKNNFYLPDNCPEDLKDIIRKLLVNEPEKRLGTGGEGSDNDYMALKSHEFFSGLDFGDLDKSKPEFDEIPSPYKKPRFSTQLSFPDNFNYDFTEVLSKRLSVSDMQLNEEKAQNILTQSEQQEKDKENGKNNHEIEKPHVIIYNEQNKIDLNSMKNEEHFVNQSKSASPQKLQIILQSLLEKKSGWIFYKPRKLILTNQPRLILYDQDNIQKGEIQLNAKTSAYLDGKDRFYIKTEEDTYYFREIENNQNNVPAEDWVKTINTIIRQKYNKPYF